MKKILFILGSNRTQSFNRQVAGHVAAGLNGRAEVEWLDYKSLTFINQDEEFPTPPEVARVREAVMASDGLWVFTPEYNYSYPAIVKNLFDWLSRPVNPGDYTTPTAITGKKVTITGIGGKAKIQGCREKLRELLNCIGASPMAQTLGLQAADEAWLNNKVILDDDQKQELAQQQEAFLAFIS